MKMTRIYLFGSVFFLMFSSLFAQNEAFVQGVLRDASTGEAVVFATVRIKGRALGVISNMDGGFLIPEELLEKGSYLQISSMGYVTEEIPIIDLVRDQVNTILMRASVERLAETVVTAKRRRLTARKIIRYALKQIPENYPSTNFGLVGYYRDYQIHHQEYQNLNEAIVAVYDKGFHESNYKQTQYGILSHRRNTDFKIDSFAAKSYDYGARDKIIPNATLNDFGGNELVILHVHDAIRNHNVTAYSFVDKMVEDFVAEHGFSSVAQTSYGDEQVYKIGIKKSTDRFRAKGTIYIDKNDFAIRKLDYAVYKKASQYHGSGTEGKEKLLYEILVEYTERDDLMYLNYISFHNKFKLRRPPVFRMEKVVLNRETGYLQVQLNKPAINMERLQLSDVQLSYEGHSLAIEKIITIDSTELALKLSTKKRQVTLRNNLFADIGHNDAKKMFLTIKTLEDDEGNLIDEREEEELDQFREFFIQQITLDEKLPAKSELMDKGKPLFHEEQPILDQSIPRTYWMNTPLKKRIAAAKGLNSKVVVH